MSPELFEKFRNSPSIINIILTLKKMAFSFSTFQEGYMFSEALVRSLIVISGASLSSSCLANLKRLTFFFRVPGTLTFLSGFNLEPSFCALITSPSHLYFNPAHIKLNLRFCASASPSVKPPLKGRDHAPSTQYLLRLVRYNVQLPRKFKFQAKSVFFWAGARCCVSQIVCGTYLY